MNSTEFTNLFISQLLQLTVLISLVGLVDRAVARRHPRLVHGLWLIVLIKAITPPIWSSSAGLFSWIEAGLFPMTAAPGYYSVAGGSGGWFPMDFVLAVWLSGTLLFAFGITLRWLMLSRRIHRDGIPVTEKLQKRIDRFAGEMGFRATPDVKICDGLGPAVFGIARPKLCLPSSLVKNTPVDELDPIVVHELLHLKRRDTVVSLLQLAVTCLWWFNPLVWLASRSMTRVTEFCVDDEVARWQGCSPKSYAQALLGVLELRCRSGSLAVMSGASPAIATSERIEHLLSEEVHSDRKDAFRGWRMWPVLAVLLIVFLPGKPLSVFVPTCTPGVIADSPTLSEIPH